MNGLLGLSEPQFLACYLVALAIAVQWARVMRRRMRTVKGARTRRPLSLDEFAYLAGGPRRVTETAVTRLIELGVLRLGRNGAVETVSKTSRDPIDRAVLADADQGGNYTITTLAARMAREEAVTAIGRRLADLGLTVHPRIARRRRWTAAVPLLVVAAVGLVRLMNDLAQGQPVARLTAALVVTAAITVLFVRGTAPHRTTLGDYLLREANTNFRAVVDPACPLAGAARLVALGGLAAGRDLTVPGIAMARAGATDAA